MPRDFSRSRTGSARQLPFHPERVVSSYDPSAVSAPVLRSRRLRIEGPSALKVFVSETPKFAADCMLGKLSRWLRILGYDTTYFSYIADDHLLELCLKERRILLTSDRPLAERVENIQCVFLEEKELESQIVRLVSEADLDLDRETFTRCLLCNAPIEQVAPADVSDRVPPHVLETHDRFHRCPKCDRVYWSGSHHARMTDRLSALREQIQSQTGTVS